MNMIINLFSIFDPSINFLSFFPWIIVLITLILLNSNKFFIKNKILLIIWIILFPLIKEIIPSFKLNLKKGRIMLLLFLFISLFFINILALFPFVFTPTGHIILTFPTALIIWFCFIIYGWINNSKHIIAHLVPIGTPIILINFIVIIELVSNIIRPITLSVRLCANIVAGHLLLRLLRNFSLSNLVVFSLSFFGLVILGLLEIAVALIQRYVFITLSSLYATEVHYEQ